MGTRPLCLIYNHMLSELGLSYESKLLAVWSTAHWCLKNNKTVLKVPRESGPRISLLWTLEKMVSDSEWGGEHRRWLTVSACRLWVGTIISRFRKPIRFLPFLPFHPSLAQLCYKENRETCHLFDHHHGVRVYLSPVWDNGWIFRFSVDAWQLRCVSLLSRSWKSSARPICCQAHLADYSKTEGRGESLCYESFKENITECEQKRIHGTLTCQLQNPAQKSFCEAFEKAYTHIGTKSRHVANTKVDHTWNLKWEGWSLASLRRDPSHPGMVVCWRRLQSIRGLKLSLPCLAAPSFTLPHHTQCLMTEMFDEAIHLRICSVHRYVCVFFVCVRLHICMCVCVGRQAEVNPRCCSSGTTHHDLGTWNLLNRLGQLVRKS